MHHLDFDLPERSGFAGLFTAMDTTVGPEPATAAVPSDAWTLVSTSSGPRSPEVRVVLDAFRRDLAA